MTLMPLPMKEKECRIRVNDPLPNKGKWVRAGRSSSQFSWMEDLPINKTTSKALGVNLPETLLKKAVFVQ